MKEKKSEFSKEFLNVLGCPVCGSTLNPTPDGKELVCSKCGERYRIVNGIPVLFEDENDLNSGIKF